MKKLNLILLTLFVIINTSFAFAVGNNYNFDFYDGITYSQLTSVDALFYQCAVSGCADNYEPSRFSQKNSGGSNSISQEYLGTSNPQDYLNLFFKQCYLPLSAVAQGDWGYGQTFSYNAYFGKAASCHSPIYSFSVTNIVYENEPITINVEAKLDATTSSAFKRTGFPPLFTPQGYSDYFSAETRVILTITNAQGQVAYTETRTINLLADTSQQLTFSWTPTTANSYTAKITTDVTDCQCDSQIQENVQKDFTVLSSRPSGQCYTLLNNLQSNIIFPFVNDQITLSVGDLTNYANNLGTLTPIPSTLAWTITQVSNNNIVYSSNTNVIASSSNSAYTTSQIQFTPVSEGQYVVRVTGTPNDATCNGLQNIPETTQMTLTISKQPLVCTDIDKDGYSQEGGNCGQQDCADTNININPGATEICNNVDDNCNGQIDEALAIACSTNAQCDDSNALTTDTCNNAGTCSATCVHNVIQCVPGATESQSCGSSSVGACVLGTQTRTCDLSGSWGAFSVCSGNVEPTTETCNNVDDNCNGQIDEALAIACSTNAQCDDGIAITSDVCNNAGTCSATCVHNVIQCVPGATESQSCGSSSVGACVLGTQTRTCDLSGSWGAFSVCSGNIEPIAEICNGIDDNCDGTIDNGITCNLAPIASFTYTPDLPVQGQTIFFDATASYDPEGLSLTYSWDFENDGIIDATGVTPIFSYALPGIYTAVLAVSDGILTSTTQSTISVRVDNNVSFEIIATPQKGIAPLQVFFGANIFSGDGPFMYVWDFGDGHISFEENPRYIFYGEKIHLVTLTIYDSDGDSATNTINIDTTRDHALDSLDALYVGDATPLNEVLQKGENLVMTVSFENRAGKTLNDGTFQVSIPELGISTMTKVGKISNGKTITKTVTLNIPKNIPSGHYFVRTTINTNSGEAKRTVYREIIVK